MPPEIVRKTVQAGPPAAAPLGTDPPGVAPPGAGLAEAGLTEAGLAEAGLAGVAPTEVAARLREAITRVNRRLRQTRPVGELTVAQLSALQSLESAGSLCPGELADIERVAAPTITRIVARLEERGLLQRSDHPTDGRQVVLAASPAGRELMRDLARARDEWLAQRLAAATEAERRTLRDAAEILTRIARDQSTQGGAK